MGSYTFMYIMRFTERELNKASLTTDTMITVNVHFGVFALLDIYLFVGIIMITCVCVCVNIVMDLRLYGGVRTQQQRNI